MFRMVLKIFFLPLFFLMACGKQQANQRQPGEKIKIVATTGMIGDAVKEIAGEHADVVALMGAGVDPHLYKATHGDLERLTDADIIFYNGLHLTPLHPYTLIPLYLYSLIPTNKHRAHLGSLTDQQVLRSIPRNKHATLIIYQHLQ